MWWQIALAILSFVIQFFTRPKQKQQSREEFDAKKQPSAEEGAVVPYVRGVQWISNENYVDYFDVKTIAVKRKAKKK